MASGDKTILGALLYWWERLTGLLTTLGWLPPLLVRLFVGYFFFETGWAKVHNLPVFVERFQEWGIPYPAFNAALSAWTECVGGALTVVGLATRFASAGLVINMIVAIVTVKWKEVSGLNDFVELDEPLYALAFVWLGFNGAGAVSLDHLIRLALTRSERSKTASDTPPSLTRAGSTP
jgi:putative oxidoreductase